MNNKGIIEPVRITTAQRNALIMGGADTGVIYNTSTNQYESWNGTLWVPIINNDSIVMQAGFGVVPNVANGGVVTFTTMGLVPPVGLDLIGTTLLTEVSGVANRWFNQPYTAPSAISTSWLIQQASPWRLEFFQTGANVRLQNFRLHLTYA